MIPYEPRFPQNIIHEDIESHRFSVLVLHRRCGKSVCAINHLIKKALQCKHNQPKYAYIAPYLKQAKLIAWDYLKYYTKDIPKTEIHEGELYIKLINGARIYIFGADNPDALRGLYLDGVVLDEYGDIKPEVFNEIVRPALADRNGWALFLGTPKGQNHFYELYLNAEKKMAEGDKDWYAAKYAVQDTNVIPPKELESLKSSLTESAFRQEFGCDFTSSSDNVLIPLDVVLKAIERKHGEFDFEDQPLVMSVDPARFGDDSSVILWRQGFKCYPPKVFRKIDNMQLVGHVSRLISELNPQTVFIDSGHGSGVIDRLRQLGHSVTEVHFGSLPFNDGKYLNKRAEMWDLMRLWLEKGGSIPNDVGLKSELTSVQYDFNSRNQLRLEAKDKVKDRIGKSPDLADALALTFSYPVGQKNIKNLQKTALV